MKTDEKTECAAELLNVYASIRRLVYKAFDMQENKLTRNSQVAMIVLRDLPKVSMSDFAVRINSSSEQATREVKKLLEMGYVERCRSNYNRRVIFISMTQEGRAYLDRVTNTLCELIGKNLDSSDTHFDEMIKVTKTLADSITLI